jgi:hypothetical protein
MAAFDKGTLSARPADGSGTAKEWNSGSGRLRPFIAAIQIRLADPVDLRLHRLLGPARQCLPRLRAAACAHVRGQIWSATDRAHQMSASPAGPWSQPALHPHWGPRDVHSARLDRTGYGLARSAAEADTRANRGAA